MVCSKSCPSKRAAEKRARVNIFAKQSENFCVDRFGKRTSVQRSPANGVRLVDEKLLALAKTSDGQTQQQSDGVSRGRELFVTQRVGVDGQAHAGTVFYFDEHR